MQRNSEQPADIIIAADYDGCFDVFFPEIIGCLTRKFPDLTLDEIESWRKEFWDFFHKMIEEVIIEECLRGEHPEITLEEIEIIIELMFATARQSHLIDRMGSRNGNGLCIPNFQKLCEEKNKPEEKSKGKIKWNLNPLLYADVKHKINGKVVPGTALNNPNLDCEIIDNKIAIVQAHLDHIAQRPSQKPVHYFFFDNLYRNDDEYKVEVISDIAKTADIKPMEIYLLKDEFDQYQSFMLQTHELMWRLPETGTVETQLQDLQDIIAQRYHVKIKKCDIETVSDFKEEDMKSNKIYIKKMENGLYSIMCRFLKEYPLTFQFLRLSEEELRKKLKNPVVKRELLTWFSDRNHIKEDILHGLIIHFGSEKVRATIPENIHLHFIHFNYLGLRALCKIAYIHGCKQLAAEDVASVESTVAASEATASDLPVLLQSSNSFFDMSNLASLTSTDPVVSDTVQPYTPTFRERLSEWSQCSSKHIMSRAFCCFRNRKFQKTDSSTENLAEPLCDSARPSTTH